MYEKYDPSKTYFFPNGETADKTRVLQDFPDADIHPYAIEKRGDIIMSMSHLDVICEVYNVEYEDTDAVFDKINEAVKKLKNTPAPSIDNINDAIAAANEAKQIVEQANSAPVIFAAKAFVSQSTTLTNTDAGQMATLIPDWQPDISYKQGQLVKYDNKVYRLAQDTISTDIYKPRTGTESLYTLIDIAEDGVRVWHMPTDATNSFALNELAHYPTASDPIYRSKRNGNTSEPTKDEWWELDE